MYQLSDAGAVMRLADGAIIPADRGNVDYRAYLAWLDAGNTPQPAAGPSLSEVKAEAEAKINQRIERAKIEAGILVGLPGMVAQYASNAFYVERWVAAGRPTAPDPADYPTAEAERQGFNPEKSLFEMLATWEAMWKGMNAAGAALMLARRRALEGVKQAEAEAEVEAALAGLENDLAAL